MVVLLLAQALAFAILLVRLAAGARRPPPVDPWPAGADDTSVTVIIPTLNEGRRIAPCLRGLSRQGPPLAEVIVVDSGSNDGTAEQVLAAAAADPRIRLVRDPPLPPGWIGKVWALQHALGLARGEWILGLDADVEPLDGAVAGAVRAARDNDLDLVSFGPRFADQSGGERWLHPSLLLTLVYRAGPPTLSSSPHRAMANGQCMLARRKVLEAHGGYSVAQDSFADDVTLARRYAGAGMRVGFLDGSRMLRVRAYTSLAEMWREWGRSIDLRDATTPLRQWLDIVFLTLTMALPIPLLLAAAAGLLPATGRVLLGINLGLVGVRTAMLFAIAPAYERRGVTYWLSPLADLLAVVRIVVSTLVRPRQWRGRLYTLR